MGKTFNPQKLNPTPGEMALLKAAEEFNIKIETRAHLLSLIDSLDLDKISVDVRMVYVKAMLSVGFSKARALKRLKVSSSEFYDWKQKDRNALRLEECSAMGGLILEDTLLQAAEKDPKIALGMLQRKDKEDEKEEQGEEIKKRNVMEFYYEGLKERGVLQEGEVVDKLSEGVPDEFK